MNINYDYMDIKKKKKNTKKSTDKKVGIVCTEKYFSFYLKFFREINLKLPTTRLIEIILILVVIIRFVSE